MWISVSRRTFRDIELLNFYSTTGDEIAEKFVQPVLGVAASFDRLTGYFSIASLVSISRGLQNLYINDGKMRLVIGIHDVPKDLISAMSLGQLLPETLVDSVQQQLMHDLELLADEAQKSAISAVAWLIRLGILEVKVAAPRASKGIFHQKRMIFRDYSGNVIAGTGSLNETMGSRDNIEEMQFNFSWRGGDKTIELLV
ncbi:MAG: hypothetical protein F2839_06920, partial [Actinobacteria bacterium]|nr:hypothetical protein [Actinomycetota bacterium]